MLVTSVLALFGVGAAAAVILALASQLLKVEENPKIEGVTEVLPGANCGGCGFAGCEAYAAAVVTNPDIPANLCVVGGAETSDKVGQISGKAVAAGEPVVSFRRCSRVEGHVKAKFDYVGTSTCASAALLEGGPFMCAWACLGLGDCMRACPFDAMYIANGMVEIIASKCVSCGQCAKVCPRSILQLIPRRARVMNPCATREKLKSVSDVCDVGCINCLKCLKACPADAISYEKRRIEIDHIACLEFGPACGQVCVNSCPRGIMRSRVPADPAPDISDAESVAKLTVTVAAKKAAASENPAEAAREHETPHTVIIPAMDPEPKPRLRESDIPPPAEALSDEADSVEEGKP
ncbi:MAG: Fe-S cluster domain-containing protein [Desulfovibrio sp.]|jgi:electron transport complex protein RnfB|nr:Fe-S cluster domain-containing protein [Desulfovibrio sp.]